MNFNVNPDISKAKSIDSEFYTDPKYLSLSLNKIFKKSWQLACHKSELSNTNIYPFTFLENSVNEPFIITKLANELHCVSNVCTHRGHIVHDEQCTRKKMKCGYHGRTFELDGTIDRMPGFEGVKIFQMIMII